MTEKESYDKYLNLLNLKLLIPASYFEFGT